MISIYIHIPFCLQKCNYCSFVSVTNATATLRSNYVSALIREIELSIQMNDLSAEPVSTIFFGGGTPTVLLADCIHSILNAIQAHCNVSKLKEVSIEVNPATNIDFGMLKSMGFNRISIGVQSFHDSELQFLGRLHNAQTAEATIIDAQKHFDNVSVDLIYGIPKLRPVDLLQAVSMFEYSLNKVISLGVPHISAYSMIFEPETKLFQMQAQNQCQMIEEATEYTMYSMLCDKLSQHKIYQYEVSNFALHGMECQHNKVYWERGNYMGFGVAAHSLLNSSRFANTSNIKVYIGQWSSGMLQYEEKEALTDKQVFEEKIFLGLRSRGIEQNILNAKQTNFMFDCVRMGYAIQEGNMFVLTNSGRFITDSIVMKLI